MLDNYDFQEKKKKKKNYWHRVSRNSVPTNPGSALGLGKEFPVSAPWVIQGENPSVRWPLKIVCTQGDLNLRIGGEHTPKPKAFTTWVNP